MLMAKYLATLRSAVPGYTEALDTILAGVGRAAVSGQLTVTTQARVAEDTWIAGVAALVDAEGETDAPLSMAGAPNIGTPSPAEVAGALSGLASKPAAARPSDAAVLESLCAALVFAPVMAAEMAYAAKLGALAEGEHPIPVAVRQLAEAVADHGALLEPIPRLLHADVQRIAQTLLDSPISKQARLAASIPPDANATAWSEAASAIEDAIDAANLPAADYELDELDALDTRDPQDLPDDLRDRGTEAMAFSAGLRIAWIVNGYSARLSVVGPILMRTEPEALLAICRHTSEVSEGLRALIATFDGPHLDNPDATPAVVAASVGLKFCAAALVRAVSLSIGNEESAENLRPNDFRSSGNAIAAAINGLDL
jgi:hypothetical protein